MSFSRREFVVGMGGVAAAATMPTKLLAQGNCPFRLSVINDEISQDFDHACYVTSHDFGLGWIEIRGLWNKSLPDLTDDQIKDVTKILTKYNLKVTDFASPLFKTDLPGAPVSKESPKRDQFNAKFDYQEQDALLGRLIEMAKIFGTDRIRCFDFWRLDDQKPWRAEINRKLTEAAEKCARHDIILLLENEMACNTGSGPEALTVLNAIPNKNFMLNWDAANSGSFAGDVPYPDDYEKLPKHRIGHVHCKNVIRTPDKAHPFEWQPVDIGLVDWIGQFKALKRDNYHYAVSLETHWRGAPGATADTKAEASTRISMKGLKACLGKAGIKC
jgi:sugar phosphate isomerase/epimerase